MFRSSLAAFGGRRLRPLVADIRLALTAKRSFLGNPPLM